MTVSKIRIWKKDGKWCWQFTVTYPGWIPMVICGKRYSWPVAFNEAFKEYGYRVRGS